MPLRGRSSRSGIILVLVAGLLALVWTLVILFGAQARAAAGTGKTALEKTTAGLAAESGLGYAAARLRERSDPLYPATPETARDDWTFRDGPHGKLAGAASPSYAREGGAGTFPFSGRLRGEGRFALRIESSGGKIPVNADLKETDDGEGGVGAVFIFDPLVFFLNNLGAIVLAENRTVGRLDALQTGFESAEPIRVSRLGEQLMSARPVSGYRSLEEIRQILLALGYAPAECDRIVPFLDVGPYETLDGVAQVSVSSDDAVVPIEILSAPREVLEAMWLYQQMEKAPCLCSHPDLAVGYGGASERAGGVVSMRDAALMIYPDEAANLADWAIRFRRRPDRTSWLAFRRDLAANVLTIFETDMTILGGGGSGLDWTRAKADLVFFTVFPDGAPVFSWPRMVAHWGIDHGVGSMPPAGPRPFLGVSAVSSAGHPAYPDAAGTWPHGETPYCKSGSDSAGFLARLTLAPPTCFRIDSLGSSRGNTSSGILAKGFLRASERIEFSVQEQFENVGGSPLFLARRAIHAIGEGDRSLIADPVPPLHYPGLVTLPNRNARGFLANPSAAFSSMAGSLALAGRACGPQGAGQYWAFTEDANPADLAEFTSEGPAPIMLPSLTTEEGPWSYSGKYFYSLSSGNPPIYWPGLTNMIRAMSIECWARPRSEPIWKMTAELRFDMSPSNPPFQFRTAQLELVADVGWDPARGYGVLYTLRTAAGGFGWPLSDPPNLPPLFVFVQGFSPDTDLNTNRTRFDQDHVVATFQKPFSGETEIALYVNGELLAPAVRFPFKMKGAGWPTGLELKDVDEMRLYNGLLTPTQVRDRYRLGRYVVPPSGGAGPTYTSPLYVLDKPGVLKRANWTGVPAGEPPGQERVGIRVRVHGYADAAGTVPVAGSPLTLADTFTISDLSLLGTIRSFRYEVEFYNLAPAGIAPDAPLYKTPFFEGVWFTLERRGRCGWLE